MNTFQPHLTLKLSIQTALLGEQHIQIRAYFAGKVTQEDIERLGLVSAEVIADFPDGYTIDESAHP